KLYHNEGARPGLRVRLKGPPGNPNGVGAVLRLKRGQQFGPAREIHSGSGYWSQDGAVQVLAASDSATQIWIRWPGGQTMTGDGLVDLYFCGLDNHNVLYRNLGQWKFEDITASARVGCSGQYSTGAVLADIDGDGDLDLLVNALGGGTRLFLNDGRAHFTEST